MEMVRKTWRDDDGMLRITERAVLSAQGARICVSNLRAETVVYVMVGDDEVWLAIPQDEARETLRALIREASQALIDLTGVAGEIGQAALSDIAGIQHAHAKAEA